MHALDYYYLYLDTKAQINTPKEHIYIGEGVRNRVGGV